MKPIIAVVDDEPQDMQRISAMLEKRYSADYEIYCQLDPGKAVNQFEQWTIDGRELALVLAGCWITETSGAALLQAVRNLHPGAGRGLLINRGDGSVSETILEAIALDRAQAYGLKPWTDGDESFHRFITRFLDDWAHGNRPRFELVRLIGPQDNRRCFELRDLLERNGISYGYYQSDSEEGIRQLDSAGIAKATRPIAILANGVVLRDPNNRDLAEALDLATFVDVTGVPEGELVDVAIVGAGPAGLSAAVYAASEGLHTVVIEREAIGGQAGMSARIRNYLGFPTGISGSDLAQRAYQQAWLFGADFTFAQAVESMLVENGVKVLQLTDGAEVRSKTVVLTMGVAYRHLDIEPIEKLIGAGVYYGSPSSEALAMRGQRAFILGGGNSAGQAAVHLARFADSVTMIVRDSSLAVNMSNYLVKEVERHPKIEVWLNSEVVGGGGQGHLEHLLVAEDSVATPRRVPAEALFILIGAHPKTDWLPDSIKRVGNGYVVTGDDLLDREGNLPSSWPLQRKPYAHEASIPGVFAAGDVRHHSVRRVASAVGEGAMTVHLIHQYLAQG